MTGKQKTRCVAGLIVIVSAINLALLFTLMPDQNMLSKGFRFAVTCLFSVFLFLGAPWARWIVGVLSALGAVSTLAVGAIVLAKSGGIPSGLGLMLGWQILLAVCFAVSAFVLLLDKGVAAYFAEQEKR